MEYNCNGPGEERNKRLRYVKHQPKYATFATLTARESSFIACTQLHVSQKNLAAAGFFFIGTDDQCRCFHCGIGLRQWSRTDDPWVEHAKYSPKCQHVISNMGMEFINNVKLAFEITSEGELQFHTTTAATTEETTTEETTTTATTEETTTTATTEETTEGTTPATTAAETTTPTETAEQNASLTDEQGQAVSEIEQENRRLNELQICKVCLDLTARMVFFPCQHTVCCEACAMHSSMINCPVCRTVIKYHMKIRFAEDSAISEHEGA